MRRSIAVVALVALGLAAFAWPFVAGADHAGNVHWEATAFPLRLRLKIVDHVGPRWDAQLRDTVDAWDRLTTPDRFTFNVERADVRVGCQADAGLIPVREWDNAGFYGSTVAITEGRGADQHIVKVKVLVSNPAHEGRPDFDRRATMCHELGHALGLIDHSLRPNVSCVTNKEAVLDDPGPHDNDALETNPMYGHTH